MKILFFVLILVFLYSTGNTQIYYQHWVARYNGPENNLDAATGIVNDAYGNQYVTGKSYNSSSLYDCMTLRYNSNGTLQKEALYNSSSNGPDESYAIAIDANRNIYITGYTFLSDGICYILTIKYNSELEQQWVRTFKRDNFYYNKGYSIAVYENQLASGPYIYVTGETAPTSESESFYSNIITIKYNSSGDLLWSKEYSNGGTYEDIPEKIVVDSYGNSYIVGYSVGYGTSHDIVTIKYDFDGVEKWVNRYNGYANMDDMGFSIARFIC